jgi:lipoprotein NlpI
MIRLFSALLLPLIAAIFLAATKDACGLADEKDKTADSKPPAKADDPPTASDLLVKARAAFREGKRDEAIQLATRAIAIDKENVPAYVLRASMHDAMRQFDKAIADYDKVIELEPDAASAYQQRGSAHFRAGHIKESIADFDVFLKHNPADEPHHWQRGLSYYYAGEFAKGVRQFEMHKTVNPQDVENAVWHYLCKARIDGVEKARAALIEIHSDRRPWAMPVYEMFQGKLKPEDLLKKMEAVEGNEARKKDALYFTHLYIGLFYEADGKADLAKKHIEISVEKYGQPHYMGDVARVHLMQLKKGAQGRKRIMYVVDASGSNLEAFPFILLEMRRSINALAETQAFKVVFAQQGRIIAWPFHGFQESDGGGRSDFFRWLETDGPAPGGKTDLLPALRYALVTEVEWMAILSDGLGDGRRPAQALHSLPPEVKAINAGSMKIHCIDFALRVRGDAASAPSFAMQQIAADSGGIYKLVTAADLAVAAPK